MDAWVARALHASPLPAWVVVVWVMGVCAVGCCSVVACGATAQAQQLRGGMLRLGIEGGVDYPGDEFSGNGMRRPASAAGAIDMEITATRNLGFQFSWLGGTLGNAQTGLYERKFHDVILPPGFDVFDEANYQTTYFGMTLGALLHVPVASDITPFLVARGGLIGRSTTGRLGTKPVQYKGDLVTLFGAGGGVEYAMTPSLSVRLTFVGYMTTTDLLDAFAYGSGKDGLATLALGVVWTLPLDRDGSERTRRSPSSPEVLGAQTNVRAAQGTRQKAGAYGQIPHTDSSAAAHAGAAFVPEGESAPGNTADGASGHPLSHPADAPAMLAVDAHLTARDVASLDEYLQAPDALMLELRRNGVDALRLRTRLEVSRSGAPVLTGRGTILLMSARAELDVRSFIDPDSLHVVGARDDGLPEGSYDVRLDLVHEESGRSVSCATTFRHLDLERTFGGHAARIRYLVRMRSATVERDSAGTLWIDTFVDGEDPLAPTAQRLHRREGRQPQRGVTTNLGGEADALSVIPATVLYGERPAYVASLVRNAVMRAGVVHSAQRDGMAATASALAATASASAATASASAATASASAAVVHVVVARIYFAADGAVVPDEGGMILTELAQLVARNAHMELGIVGGADDGEQARMGTIGMDRARAVAAALSAAGVPAPRISLAAPMMHASMKGKRSVEQRQESRRVDILVTHMH